MRRHRPVKQAGAPHSGYEQVRWLSDRARKAQRDKDREWRFSKKRKDGPSDDA